MGYQFNVANRQITSCRLLTFMPLEKSRLTLGMEWLQDNDFFKSSTRGNEPIPGQVSSSRNFNILYYLVCDGKEWYQGPTAAKEMDKLLGLDSWTSIPSGGAQAESHLRAAFTYLGAFHQAGEDKWGYRDDTDQLVQVQKVQMVIMLSPPAHMQGCRR